MFGKVFVALSVAAGALAQSTFSIATPAALVQCQPVAVSWTGGTAPFILSVVPGGQPSAPALSTLSTSLTSSPYTWIVDLAAGTSVTLLITDSTGLSTGSSDRVIQPGSSNSCLNASASTSGIETTGAITTTGSGTSVTLSGTTSAAGIASTSITTSRTSMTSMTSMSAMSSSSSARQSTSSTPVASQVSASVASGATSAAPSNGALSNAVIGFPAVAAGLIGGLAVLF